MLILYENDWNFLGNSREYLSMNQSFHKCFRNANFIQGVVLESGVELEITFKLNG